MGLAVDYARTARAKSDMQASLDAALLAGVREDKAKWIERAGVHFDGMYANQDSEVLSRSFAIAGQDTLTGQATGKLPTFLGGVLGVTSMEFTVKGEVTRGAPGNGCILLLDPDERQSLLVNSGAQVVGRECEIHVHSTARPAAIINAGTTLDVKRICIKGTDIIKNTSASMPIELGCTPMDDPHAGRLSEPHVGACTNAQQVIPEPGGGAPYFMPAGSVWCDAIFNGSPTIQFAPGLHIIKGRMIINANATVRAEGVTFYFPDSDSEMRINGGITSVMTAPTSGPYAGILMFEKKNLSARRQYIFNGSVSETLEGLIWLPSRDVTVNSKSTVRASKVFMVFNTLILNNTDWDFEPDPRWSGTGSSASFYMAK
jgi:hypothetical protein